jgi:hypothetical protein
MSSDGELNGYPEIPGYYGNLVFGSIWYDFPITSFIYKGLDRGQTMQKEGST